MLQFAFWTVAYPLSLYLFSYLFADKKHKNDPKIGRTALVRCIGTIVCTVCLVRALNLSWSFCWSMRLLTQTCIVALPFFTNLLFNGSLAAVNWWSVRCLLIAPAIEELYYRMLLTHVCPRPIWLWSSMAFASAHLHELVVCSQKRRDWRLALPQFCVTFLFGALQYSIYATVEKRKVSGSLWLCLTLSHVLANFVGFPLLDDEHPLHKLQQFILFFLYPLLLIASRIFL